MDESEGSRALDLFELLELSNSAPQGRLWVKFAKYRRVPGTRPAQITHGRFCAVLQRTVDVQRGQADRLGKIALGDWEVAAVLIREAGRARPQTAKAARNARNRGTFETLRRAGLSGPGHRLGLRPVPIMSRALRSRARAGARAWLRAFSPAAPSVPRTAVGRRTAFPGAARLETRSGCWRRRIRW